MRLLFITYDFYPVLSANSSIVYNLSKVFINMGHEVDVFPLKPDTNLALEEVWQDIRIHRMHDTFNKQQLKKHIKSKQLSSAFSLGLAILGDRFQHKEYRTRQWSYFSSKRLRTLLTQYGYDIIINVCYPFESCSPILQYIKKYPKNFSWIIYMQDPFASNYYYQNKYPIQDLKLFETNAFLLADRIIVTEPIMQELLNGPYRLPFHKFKVLNFPLVKKPRKLITYEEIVLPRHYVNCVFVGKFNHETRNPKMLLSVFGQFTNKPILLHIIGEDRRNWESFLNEKDNIIFHGMKPKDVAINAELNANILINVGNSVSNQLPSKLLEYISTGKPILNFYKTQKCPTLEYMARYPYGFNVHEDCIDGEMLEKIYYFCIKYRKININYRQIYRRYYDCTLDYVGYEFIKLCNEISNNNQQSN